jgi:uncharacterized DUF497 family protein
LKFIWATQNLTHLAGHGVTPEIAEALFFAEDRRAAPSAQGHGRTVIEASHSGRIFRMVFTLVGPDEIFVITAFPIRRRPL